MVPIYPLAPNTAPLQRGPWRSGQEGRSLQPGQGGRLVALGLEPGVVLLILRTLVSFFVPPSPPLITCTPTGGTEAFSVFFSSSLSLSCVVPPGGWSLFLHAGEREKQKHFSLLSVLPSLVAPRRVFFGLVWGHAWGLLGEVLGVAGPCGWRGSLIGEGWGKGCPAGWDPPHLRARGRGLSCLGFSEGGRRESLNGETNKTLSLTLLSVRS